ncbi:hypothetical protein, partial [Enterococcus faecium]|uniref:hypothetical protein n=1 Tax=Enterococcus faecium TaxID=1352 RepID=UPI0039FD8FCA
MENFQRKRLKPMAYVLIIVSLATGAVPAGQSLLMPGSSITTPLSTTITTTTVERPVTLDG